MDSKRIVPYSYRDVRQIISVKAFHKYLISHALSRYEAHVGSANLGSALAVCANFREAHHFKPFAFEGITITGTGDRGAEVREAAEGDARVSYQQQNCESLQFASNSFDLVFCKEGLHHLARPVLGLYEMLRVCNKAVIIIEPYESPLERLLGKIGIATSFERRQSSFMAITETGSETRHNYVFHWSSRQLQTILNSYYLDSGYSLEMHVGWLTKRVARSSRAIKEAVALCGSLAAHVPGLRGNLFTALIIPGHDVPRDPHPFAELGGLNGTTQT